MKCIIWVNSVTRILSNLLDIASTKTRGFWYMSSCPKEAWTITCSEVNFTYYIDCSLFFEGVYWKGRDWRSPCNEDKNTQSWISSILNSKGLPLTVFLFRMWIFIIFRNVYWLCFIEGHQTLPWATRIKVAIGVARALVFLHNLEMPIIHRE